MDGCDGMLEWNSTLEGELLCWSSGMDTMTGSDRPCQRAPSSSRLLSVRRVCCGSQEVFKRAKHGHEGYRRAAYDLRDADDDE